MAKPPAPEDPVFRTRWVHVFEEDRGEEEIYRPGEAEPLRLSRHSAALRLLQYVRDEAHRFAQHYHKILRRKRLQGD